MLLAPVESNSGMKYELCLLRGRRGDGWPDHCDNYMRLISISLCFIRQSRIVVVIRSLISV